MVGPFPNLVVTSDSFIWELTRIFLKENRNGTLTATATGDEPRKTGEARR